MNDEKLITLIMEIVRYAGDFRAAEGYHLGIDLWDGSSPPIGTCKDKLNEKLAELWKEIKNEPTPPTSLQMVLDEEEEEEEEQ